jgi:nucleotide-binding universal stress UspA family protein
VFVARIVAFRRSIMSFLPKQVVVVPVDFSDGSVEALKTALSLTGTSAGLRLVHVLLPLDAVAPGSVWGTIDDGSRLTATRKYFDEFLKKEGFEGVESTVRIGDPGWEVAEYAKEVGGELIVIPSHGYHGLKRVVLGSVAERVIRHANCAVLVLRRPDAE